MGTLDENPENRVEPAVQGPSKETPPQTRANPGAPASRRLALIALLAALLASLASWLLGESGLLKATPKTAESSMMGRPTVGVTQDTLYAAMHRTAALTYGAFGALLGIALGFVGGLHARKRWAIARASAVGLVAGGLAGVGLSYGLVPLVQNNLNSAVTEGLLAPMAMHGGIFASLGSAAGLALGFGFGFREKSRLLKTAGGGALGAVLAGVLYEIIGALLFPLAETALPVSESWVTRLLALLLVAVGATLGAVLPNLEAGSARSNASTGT